MKDYELTVLFHPDLEMNLDPALDKVKKIIEANHGEITKISNDGKKRLSYSINGQDFAVYYYIDVQLPAAAPGRISSTLNITDEVLRYLLVRTDARKAKLAARRATSNASGAASTLSTSDVSDTAADAPADTATEPADEPATITSTEEKGE